MRDAVESIPILLADGLGRIGKGIGKPGPCHSFTEGTQVELANGEKRQIQDVKVGDEVLATDPETGKTHKRRVIATIITNDDKEFTRLTIRAAGEEDEITSTDNHPFWSPNRHAWVNAANLVAGDTLITPTGSSVQVVETRHYLRTQPTYDLTVDRTRTYYVLAGATPVLVHNSNGLCGVTSAIHDDPYLVKAAEADGKNQRIQKEMDDLVMQFRGGNTNPGLVNKSLAGTDVSYPRDRNGGRVFFRNTDDGMQIVGKADKSNESKVISRLTDMYGN
ncbi:MULTISPECIES: polymorphic toxin-type HINT domain-containing protein [unclassified Streptomyces]|uniref:polymorphic toxin-type HINT domain-containing protein n=1 Tax=unclassified Streptomyces TaxID=2593676 RepID=UPI001EF08A2B|nr:MULTISPECIES: polymorphic toxin-type HINT domain-containing protein [unclassified Streptomyces]